MALAADDQLGRGDAGPMVGRQAVNTILPDADHGEPGCGHAASLNALIAAAAMALPPRRPRTVRYGTPSFAAISASLDSRAPTKPTGNAKITAGLGPPDSIRSIR